MLIVQICIGSSCYLKGSQTVIELFQKAVEEYKLMNCVTLAGSFCSGRCNREGVTITVNDDVYTGITPENFKEFFEDKILKVLREAGEC